MIKIKRWYHPDCTIGRLQVDNFHCFTLELAWKQNEKSVSCIPPGIYEYKFRESPKNGSVIELIGVKNRSYIQIHKGNYTKDVSGCILCGDGIKWIDGDTIPDVTNSTQTLKKLLKAAKGHDLIEIK